MKTIQETNSFQISAWVGSDIGQVRQRNEDNYLVDSEHGLFIVADGMGGCAHGEKASRLAIETFSQHLRSDSIVLSSYELQQTNENQQRVRELLNKGLEKANQVLVEEREGEGTESIIGTTLSALLILGNKGFVCHVGDSRVYLFRQKELKQLTEDHSLVAQQIQAGIISEEDAERSPYKNILLQALGRDNQVMGQVACFDLEDGDQFLICSDGLYNYLTAEELLSVFSDEDGQRIVPRLIDSANQRGGQDNITAITIRVSSPEHYVRTQEFSLVDSFGQSALFRGLTSDEISIFLQQGQTLEVIEGENIFLRESLERKLYFIFQGEVTLSYKHLFQKTLQFGNFFGLGSLVNGEQRLFDAKALSKTRLLVVERKELLTFIRNYPATGMKILWNLLKESSNDVQHLIRTWESEQTFQE